MNATQRTITAEQYAQVQADLQLLARAVYDMPLAAFLGAIDRCETMGPILDPTLFREAADKLGNVKRLAIGALALQREVRQLATAAGGRR